LLGAINDLWDPLGGSDVCTNMYLGYFARDPALLDQRLDNPAVQHFGYCSRGFVTFLAVVGVLYLAFLMLQFLFLLLAFVVRFCRPSDVYDVLAS